MTLEIQNQRIVTPFSLSIHSETGIPDNHDTLIERYLSKLADIYLDSEAAEAMVREKGDILTYQVFEKDIPEVNGELRFCSSIVYPGKVGDEYFMTKGHFHSRRDTAEIYYCIRGEGFMLMETEEGAYALEAFTPGRTVYVPGYYAHRSINTGTEPLVMLPIYPGDAGHDYGTIEHTGFKHLVVESDGKPTVIENPKYTN